MWLGDHREIHHLYKTDGVSRVPGAGADRGLAGADRGLARIHRFRRETVGTGGATVYRAGVTGRDVDGDDEAADNVQPSTGKSLQQCQQSKPRGNR